jgi:AraC-like DNA-binding protein
VPFSLLRAAILVRLALLRLAHTDDHVRQIAYDLDYSHESAMNHHFTAVMGMSPRAFRKLVLGTANEGGRGV